MHKRLAVITGLLIASATLVTTLHVQAQSTYVDTTFAPSPNDPRSGCLRLNQYCEQAKSINTAAEQLLAQNGQKTKFGKPSVCYTYESVCRKTGCLCTREYKPVCGTDGVTYSNACNARCKNVSIAYEGTCKSRPPSPTPDPSPCICTMEYRPVCGVNGVTYSNRCHAKCAKVAVAYEGQCNRSSSSRSSASSCLGNRPFCYEGSTCCPDGQWRCNNADTSPACEPKFDCQSQGSCLNGTSCPSGTYCSGYPSYGCYAAHCPVPL